MLQLAQKNNIDKKILAKLADKSGIEELVKNDPELQTNIETWWSKKKSLNMDDVNKFLLNLATAKALQDALPERMMKLGNQMALFRKLLTGDTQLQDARDQDYLRALENVATEKKVETDKIDDNFVVDNIETLTEALKKLKGIATAKPAAAEPAAAAAEPAGAGA